MIQKYIILIKSLFEYNKLPLENQILNNQQTEVDSEYPLRKGWALRENQIFGKRGGGKRMSDEVKKMLERMFLLGNLNPKDRMNAKDMYERLKEFSYNGELEEEEIPKISTIQSWISRFTQKFKKNSTKAALTNQLT